MLEKVEDRTTTEVNLDETLEDGLLLTSLGDFRIREYPLGDGKRVRSIFDIPYLMKKSTKPDLYYEDSVLQILRSEISELRGYLSRFSSSKELPGNHGIDHAPAV